MNVLEQFLRRMDAMANVDRLTNERTLKFRDYLVNNFDYVIGSHHLFAYGNQFELKLSKDQITMIYQG